MITVFNRAELAVTYSERQRDKLLAALVRAGIGCKLRQRRGANGEAEFTLYVDRADLDAALAIARAAVADLSALSAKYL